MTVTPDFLHDMVQIQYDIILNATAVENRSGFDLIGWFLLLVICEKNVALKQSLHCTGLDLLSLMHSNSISIGNCVPPLNSYGWLNQNLIPIS